MEIQGCDRPLSHGRTCVHAAGHDGKHSHTWQPGDARYITIDEKLIDMETGEVVGYTGGLGQRVIEEITGERINHKPESPEDKQAKARRVLAAQYGAKIPAEIGPVYASPPKGYDWHYEGTYQAYGTDRSGHSVEFDFSTGKLRRIYSTNQRREAIAYARQFGATKAAEKFGIPANTIYGWTSRQRAARPRTASRRRVMTRK